MAACPTLLPKAIGIGPLRDVTARDLIRMRNVGAPDGSYAYGASPLGLSPDGRHVAFVIDQSDPDTDSYCQALVLLDLDRQAAPRILDQGGERIAEVFPLRGAFVSDGWPQVVTPIWSPDGQSIAYLKRVAGVTQLWVVDADGSGATDVSHSDVDVENWTWSKDGATLIFATRPGLAAAKRAIADEGKTGWLYDGRMWLGMAPGPLPPADTPQIIFATDRSGQVRPATPAEQGQLARQPPIGTSTVSDVTDRRGWRAVAESENPTPNSPKRIRVVRSDGRELICAAAACGTGVVALWWDGQTVLFLRREGWARELMALYRWSPGPRAPRRILSTGNVLLGCAFAKLLVCTSENSAVPRKLVSIDPASGRTRTLFDPNPEFARIRLGSVERLRVRNLFGLPSWGDLVLPPDYAAGTKLPMVVVQYHSRGFLRGGTGDEYPIFLYAARGFAVLSVEEPPDISSAYPDLKTWDEANAIGIKDWGERRNTLSSLEEEVKRAIATGAVDPKRIGITGLSDGATTVQFALVNTKLFAAAAMSTCCMEPETVMTQGIAWADFNRKVMGYPPLTRPDPHFWQPLSLVENASRIDVPILMQVADREYPQALEAFSALREQGKPVEMYVFPKEYHTKIEPRHRLAAYERGIDWFSFWLQDKEDPDPAKAAQYARWSAMRSARRVR